MNYKYQERILFYGFPHIAFLSIAALKAQAIGHDFHDASFMLHISFVIILLLLSLPYCTYLGVISSLSSLKPKGFKQIAQAYTKKTDIESIADSINIGKEKLEGISYKSNSLDKRIKSAVEYSAKLEQEKTEQIHNAILNYTLKVMSRCMDEENLTKLYNNIELYFSDDYPTTKPVSTFGKLKVIDLNHFAWNIGTRLGHSGNSKATFIKNVFATDLKALEISTLERTLRQKGACIIPIDEP